MFFFRSLAALTITSLAGAAIAEDQLSPPLGKHPAPPNVISQIFEEISQTLEAEDPPVPAEKEQGVFYEQVVDKEKKPEQDDNSTPSVPFKYKPPEFIKQEDEQQEIKEEILSLPPKKSDTELYRRQESGFIARERHDYQNRHLPAASYPKKYRAQLFESIYDKRYEHMRALIKFIDDTEVRNQAQDTPLHYALSLNDSNAAKILIGHGVDVNAKNPKGETPIMKAAAMGNQDIILHLLKADADMEQQDHLGKNAVMQSIIHNHPSLLAYLLTQRPLLEQRDKQGNTALHLAIMHHRYTMINQLLEYDIDVDAKNRQGETALHMATKLRLFDIVVALLKSDASINITNQYKHNALAIAKQNKDSALHQLLLDETIYQSLHRAEPNEELERVEEAENKAAETVPPRPHKKEQPGDSELPLPVVEPIKSLVYPRPPAKN